MCRPSESRRVPRRPGEGTSVPAARHGSAVTSPQQVVLSHSRIAHFVSFRVSMSLAFWLGTLHVHQKMRAVARPRVQPPEFIASSGPRCLREATVTIAEDHGVMTRCQMVPFLATTRNASEYEHNGRLPGRRALPLTSDYDLMQDAVCPLTKPRSALRNDYHT